MHWLYSTNIHIQIRKYEMPRNHDRSSGYCCSFKGNACVFVADPVALPAETTPKDGRRVTRGQTSGQPRRRIVISSDEEDAHTPLSKLRSLR